MPFQADRMLEMYAPIKKRFADAGQSGRLRLVVMGHVQTPSYLTQLLGALDGRAMPAPLELTSFNVETDLYGGGCSWYIRSNNDRFWNIDTQMSQMITELQSYIDGGLQNNLELHRLLLKNTYAGREFILYEGGLSTPEVKASWAPTWFALHKSDSAYALYRNALGVLRNKHVDMAIHYAFLNKLNDQLGGVWQLIESESQGVGAVPGEGPYDTSHPQLSPKLDAWIEVLPGTSP